MKREILALFVLVLLLVSGWAGYRLLFESSGQTELTLDSVEGPVRHVNGGASLLAQPGQVVRPGERLEAGVDGVAVLSFGPDTRVVLQPDSSMKVLDVQPDGVRVSLENGRVQATVHEGGPAVAVRAGEREVTARDADAVIARGSDGTVVVAPSRGSVELFGFGSTVEVSEGQRIVAPPGRAAQLVAAHQAGLLDLAAAPPRTNRTEVDVAGRTEPGARVEVVGGAERAVGTADPDGAFSIRVQLAEGKNHLELRATNVLGEQVHASVDVERDTTAPRVQVEIH